MNPSVFGCTAPDRLPISDLVAFGLVPHEVKVFGDLLRAASDQPAEPLALSALATQAVRTGLLADTAQRWLVLAGTTTGKSTLASLLFLHACHSGRRAVLLRHGRRERQQTRGALQAIVSRDEAKATITSLRRFLRRVRADRRSLRDIDLLLIDDLEVWLHPRRARLLARLWRALRVHAPSLSVVAIGDDRRAKAAMSRVAEPLQAQVLYGPAAAAITVRRLGGHQPADGLLPQEAETAEPISPDMPEAPGPKQGPASRPGPQSEVQLAEALLDLARRGEPTLVLVPQRGPMLRLLHRLLDASERRALPVAPPSHSALAELAATAAGHGQDLLRLALPHQIALEGPELTPKQRRVVAQSQARREVLLTLCHRLPPRPLSRTRVHNLVFVPSENRPQPAQPSVAVQPRDRQRALPPGLRRRLRADGQLWIAAGSEDLVAAALGELARHATHPAQARRRTQRGSGLAAFLRFLPVPTVATSCEISWLEALTLVALAGPRQRLPLLLSERSHHDYAARLLHRVDEQAQAERPLFRWLAAQRQSLTHDDLRALKAVLLLDDWLAGSRSIELEARYHIWAGQIVRCAHGMARQLRWLRAQLRHRGVSSAGQPPLDELVQRLRHAELDGVAEHRAALSRHIGVLLGAVHALEAGTVSGPARLLRR